MMQAFQRLAVACTLLWAITSTGFSLAVQSVNDQQAAPPAAAQAAAPEKTPDAAPVNKDAPKLKPDDEIALRKLREKILGDKIQIDQIAAQAQQQIAQRQQEMNTLSRELAAATDKAVTASGADKSKWDLNQDLVFVPKKPEPKPAESKPEPKKH